MGAEAVGSLQNMSAAILYQGITRPSLYSCGRTSVLHLVRQHGLGSSIFDAQSSLDMLGLIERALEIEGEAMKK